MTEVKFLEIYKKRKNLKSIYESKEKLELFWKVVFAGLAQDKKVIVKDFGVFEIKKLKPRKIYDIHKNIFFMTKERTALKFKVKNGFMKKLSKKVNSCNLTDETGIK